MPTPLEKLVRSDTAALLMLWAEGEAPGARCAGALQKRVTKSRKRKRMDGKEKAMQRREGQQRCGHEEEERSVNFFFLEQ